MLRISLEHGCPLGLYRGGIGVVYTRWPLVDLLDF